MCAFFVLFLQFAYYRVVQILLQHYKGVHEMFYWTLVGCIVIRYVQHLTSRRRCKCLYMYVIHVCCGRNEGDRAVA